MTFIKDIIKLSLIFAITQQLVAVPPREFYEDQIAEESIDDENYFSYALPPKNIFNDGKPFVVGKDPVTGQIDFSQKKTISSTPNDILDKDTETRRPSDVNKIAPNIHDFLNLPVKYSSSKSVYPLISSSYSNLKYQGNNKHYVSNHKDKEIVSTTTTSPKYYTNTMIVKSTSVTEVEGKATKRPIVSTSSMAPFSIRNRLPPTSSTTQKTTLKPYISKSSTLKPFIYTTTNKYDTKKYQDSGIIRKKTLPTILPSFKVESHPQNTFKKNNTIQLHTQLNVIPLTKKTTKAPVSVTTSSTTSTAIPFTVSTVSNQNNVRFPESSQATIKEQVPSQPITTRPTDEIISSSTTMKSKPTKKAPSLSDLFSLWSDADDEEYYDEKTEESKIVDDKKPELNFIDAPVDMLPSNFKDDDVQKSTSPVTQVKTTSLPSTTTTTVTTPTTPKSTISSTSPTTLSRSDTPPTTYSPKTTVQFFERTSPSTKYLPASPEPTKPHQTIDPKVSSSIQEKHFDLQPTQTIQENNYVSFGTGSNSLVPSRNTFVISPGQDSASIVLGSQQSFGTEGHFVGSATKENAYEPQVVQNAVSNNKFPGTVINEITGPNPENIPQGFSIKVAPQQQVRFPVPSTTNQVSFDNAPIVRGTIQNDINAQVPQSLALEQNQVNNHVKFPPTTPAQKNLTPQQMNIEIIKAIDEQLTSESIPSQVVFKDDTVPNQQNRIIPPAQDLTPPGDGLYEIPQFFERPGNGQGNMHIYGENIHRQDQRRPPPPPPNGQFNQRIPMNDRPYEMHGNHGKPPLRQVPHHQMGPQYRIDRPHPQNTRQQVIPDRMLMQDRPEAGQPLPNILPQFRPNAKVSHGHNGAPPKKEPGIIKVMETPGYKSQPPMYQHQSQQPQRPGVVIRNRPQPTFVLRRTPGPQRFISRISPYAPAPYASAEEMNPNRRHYQAGPPPMMNMQYGAPPQRYLEPNHPAFRRPLNINGMPPMMQNAPQQQIPLPNHLMGVRGEQDLLNRNDQYFQRFLEEKQIVQKNTPSTEMPPVQPQPPKEELSIRKQGRLEPVVTLQMLHAKKLAMQDKEKNVEMPVLKETVQEVPVAIETANDKKNVYVVYPLKDETDSKISVTSNGAEYQNTPFSIANTHVEQEPILTLKEKTKPFKTTQFPYAIEKPLNHKPEVEPMLIKKENFGSVQILNTGEQSSEILPNINKGQVISTTLTRVTSNPHTTGSPIAFAFTPSPRPINPKGPHIYDSTSHEMYSMPNIITHESQTEQSYFHDYDYDHRVKEPFQAPFYASANLPNKATPSNTFEGWAIVTQGTPPKFQPQYDNNQIDRADTNMPDDHLEHETEKSVTKQPEKASLEMTTAKPFDPDHFQPEFLTGFQPIYTPDTNVKQSTILEAAPRDEPIESVNSSTNKSPEYVSSSTDYDSSSKMSEEDLKETTKKPEKEMDMLESIFNALVNFTGDDESRSLKDVKKE